MTTTATDILLTLDVWNELPHHVELLRALRDHLGTAGLTEYSAVSKRRYQRSLLRKIAICFDADCPIACFAKDVSRAGVGFYSTRHLDLEKAITLLFPQRQALTLSVVRCRQLADYCYDIGTVFRDVTPRA